MRMRDFLPLTEKDNLRLAIQVTFCKQNVSTYAIIPCVSSKTWYNNIIEILQRKKRKGSKDAKAKAY